MEIKYPDVGVCGLSCRLCPRYHTDGESRCYGCKTESRMAAGCPFITCALKKKSIEFCWDCPEGDTCERWKKHVGYSRRIDSFKCYQTLEGDISFAREHGVEAFAEAQKARERLLKVMLTEFNDGRSKSYYCIAATVLEAGELESALGEARKASAGPYIKGRARALHATIDAIAARKNYLLKLRK